MRLLGAFASPYAARVIMFANLKGIDLPLDPPLGDGLKSPESMAFNPIGRMPALEVDGRCVAESSVICDYLEQTQPEPSGFPTNPYDHAMSRLVDRIVDLYIAPQIRPLFGQMNPADRDQAVVDEAGAALAAGFSYARHFMGEGTFVAGDRASLGDCSLASYAVLLQQVVFDNFDSIQDFREDGGRMQSWWQAVTSHETLGKDIQAYDAAFKEFMQMMAARR